MPEKMRKRADKLAAREKEKRELRSDKLSSTWGAMAFEGAGAGSRSQAGLGGEWPGREKLATKPPMPTRARFQSHLRKPMPTPGRTGDRGVYADSAWRMTGCLAAAASSR